MSEAYASGTWTVAAGKEQEFIDRWNEFLQWTRTTHDGLIRAVLIQDEEASRTFRSFAEWEDAASRKAWKQNPEFSKYFGPCRALCDDMSGSDFQRVIEV